MPKIIAGYCVVNNLKGKLNTTTTNCSIYLVDDLGNFIGNGSADLKYDSPYTIKAIPEEGYEVDNVILNGVSYPNGGTYIYFPSKTNNIVDAEATGRLLYDFTITNNLNGLTSDNEETIIKEDSSYIAHLTPSDYFYAIKGSKVSILMGDEEIGIWAYKNGTINIPKVKGNLIINIEAGRAYKKHLEDNSWQLISIAFKRNEAPDTWKVGDFKRIKLLDGYTYKARLVDKQIGLYPYTDGTGSSNCVFELVEMYSQTKGINTTSTNVGGWAASNMKSWLNSIVYNNSIPSELRPYISQVQVKSRIGNMSSSISESSNYLFIPSMYEFYGDSNSESSLYSNEGSWWEWYKYMVKQYGYNSEKLYKYSVTDSNKTRAAEVWLRTPYRSNGTDNYEHFTGWNYDYAIRSFKVDICFTF